MLRSRSCFFFRGANPGIENGGFTLESKWKIQEGLDPRLFPKTVRISPNTSFSDVLKNCRNFTFPMIVKPDIGGKGRGVVEIHSQSELRRYLNQCPIDFLIQEKCSYPLEAGIFFVQLPNETHGQITGIVSKKFVSLVGDGTSSLGELIRKHDRYFLQWERLKKLAAPTEWNQVLPEGSRYTFPEIGNHALGSEFIDETHRSGAALTALIQQVCNQIPGFYFGRLDIRFESWEKLERGEAFSIIEINGAGSEPTHIYDPSHSLFFAWKEIIRHWNYIFRINRFFRKSHRMGLETGIKLLFKHHRVMKELDFFSRQYTLHD